MSSAADLRQTMSGLERLRFTLEHGDLPGMSLTLGYRLVEVQDGYARFEGEPSDSVYNRQGVVHGGYAATLLNSACGCAVYTKLQPGQGHVTLELKVSYHRAITRDTGLVRAEGRVLSFTRRTGFSEGRLLNRAGRLLASATSTLLVR